MASRFIIPNADVGNGIQTEDGAKLNFFESGTSTRKDTFNTATPSAPPLLSEKNANPVVADTNGVFPDIFITGTYKVTLTDKNNVQKGFGEADPVTETVDITSSIITFDTLALAIASEGLFDGATLKLEERSTDNEGGAIWNVVLKSTVTISTGAPTVGNIVASTGDTTLAIVLEINDDIYDAKQFGAIVGGTVNTALAIEAAQTAAPTGATIRFTSGTYLFDPRALSGAPTIFTMRVDLNLDFQGGIIKPLNPGGSVILKFDVLSYINATGAQIFDVSDYATTWSAWDALFLADISGGGEFPITFGYGTTSYNKWWFSNVQDVNPYWFGGVGPAATDDALFVQICFDLHRPVLFTTKHFIKQKVILRGNEQYIDFQSLGLDCGVPAVSQGSALDFKCAFSTIKNTRVNLNKNVTWESAVHWYTNDLNNFFISHNTFDGMFIENSLVAFVIGALPSQTTYPEAQGTVVADNIATDAPLSESIVSNYKGQNNITDLHAAQPNGKVKFTGSTFNTVTTAGYTITDTERATIETRHPGTEINIVGGAIANVDTSGKIGAIKMEGGSLNIVGSDMEIANVIYVGESTDVFDTNGSTNQGLTWRASSSLRISEVTNFGCNLPLTTPAIIVHPDANAFIQMSNHKISFQAGGYANRLAPVMAGGTLLARENSSDANATWRPSLYSNAMTNAVNSHAEIALKGLQLWDSPLQVISNTLAGFALGLPNISMVGGGFYGTASLDSIAPADYPQVGSFVLNRTLEESEDRKLSKVVDVTGDGIGAMTTTHNGWTVTLGGASSAFGGGLAVTTQPMWGFPKDGSVGGFTGDTLLNGYNLVGSGGSSVMTSANMPVIGGKTYLVYMFIRAKTSTTGVFSVKGLSFKFDGTTAVGSAFTAFEAKGSQIGTQFYHVVAPITVDDLAQNMKLEITAADTANFEITFLDII